MRRALLLLAPLVLAGCVRHTVYRAVTVDGVVVPEGVLEIEQAHGAAAWRQQRAVQCELRIDAPDRRVIDGVLTFTTDTSRSRLDLRGGTTLIFDGRRAWIDAGSAAARARAGGRGSKGDSPFAPGDARFHLRAWPYLMAIPFKLRDPAARVVAMGDLPLGARDYPALRLTFSPAARPAPAAAAAGGDSPRDWYLIYRDPESNRVKAMAYVSTYGLAPGELPEDPQAVVYDDFQDVQGCILATRWTFYHWTPGGSAVGGGIGGDPIGHAALKNLHFTTTPVGFFDPPPGAREDVAPPAK